MKTIAYNLQKKLKESYRVINLGIPGYGIDQCLLSYEKYAKLLNPKIAVLFDIDNDIPGILEAFRKVEGMNKPSHDIINDSLQLRTNCNSSFSTNFSTIVIC